MLRRCKYYMDGAQIQEITPEVSSQRQRAGVQGNTCALPVTGDGQHDQCGDTIGTQRNPVHQQQWCVLQLFRAPQGRIQPLSQMGQDLQADDRKWLVGFPRKQGIRSLETITETTSFRNGSRIRDLWKSTRALLPSLAVSRRAEQYAY